MLKMYMGYSESLGSEEMAWLIFAHNAKEARILGLKTYQEFSDSNGFFEDCKDNRAKLLRNQEYLRKEADVELLEKDIPHVVDSVTCCTQCEQWGYEIGEDGVCSSCKELSAMEQGEPNATST